MFTHTLTLTLSWTVWEKSSLLSHTAHYVTHRSWSEMLRLHFNYHAYANLYSMQVVHWLACWCYFLLQIIALRAKHTYRVKFNTNASLSTLHFYFYINLYFSLKYKFIFIIINPYFILFIFHFCFAVEPVSQADERDCYLSFYF